MRYLFVHQNFPGQFLHLLRHLGITHVLNATQDLLLPGPEAKFE